jgi:hypothetical protein
LMGLKHQQSCHCWTVDGAYLRVWEGSWG